MITQKVFSFEQPHVDAQRAEQARLIEETEARQAELALRIAHHRARMDAHLAEQAAAKATRDAANMARDRKLELVQDATHP